MKGFCVRSRGACARRPAVSRNTRHAPPSSPAAISRNHSARPARLSRRADDIPQRFSPPRRDFQYVRREVMIPMRDGVKLYTVLIVPRGAGKFPIMLDRTPYSADKATRARLRPAPENILSPLSAELVRAGYIVAYEDVRGKYKSGGDYVMNRPVRGPLNPTAVDHSTDAYDTIDWLVKNVPESNGRVGTIGTSYDGFTALMSLVNPHPALKASVPINPMVDVWKGDDWFHNGAFRQEMISYIYGQTATRSSDEEWFSTRLRRLLHLPPLRLGRRLRPRRWGWSSCPSGGASASTPPMTNSGRTRRSTEILAARAAHRPHPARRQRVGPGRHLRRAGRVQCGQGERQWQRAPRARPMASRRGQRRGEHARPARLGIATPANGSGRTCCSRS